jgi:hypothetical protein
VGMDVGTSVCIAIFSYPPISADGGSIRLAEGVRFELTPHVLSH